MKERGLQLKQNIVNLEVRIYTKVPNQFYSPALSNCMGII